MQRVGWSAVALTLVTLAVFGPALVGEYVADDLQLVRSSPTFAGISYLWEAVRSPFWGFELGYWRPLASGLLCVGHAVAGGEAVGAHAIALLVHLLAIAGAGLAARELTGDARKALIVAALFALHPAQVEPVAWASALGDPLAGAASLFALWRWLVWRRGTRALPLGALAGLLLALLAKESGLAVVGLFVLAEWLAPGERRRAKGMVWLGVAAVVLSWLALRALVFGDVAAGFDRGRMELGFDLGQATSLRAILAARYLGVLVCPVALGPYRPMPADPSLLSGAGLPACVGLAVFAGLFVRARRRGHGAVALGLGIVAVALAPVVLLPASLGPWPVVDRYLYLAVFGLALSLCTWVRWPGWVVLAVLAAAAGRSALQVPAWRTHANVVEGALVQSPDHPLPHYMQAVLDQEAAARDRRRHASARAEFVRAAELMRLPHYAHRQLVLTIGPDIAIGGAYAALFGALLPFAQVRTEFEAAAQAFPEVARVAYALGVCYAEGNDFARAEVAFLRADALDPHPNQALALAQLFARAGRRADAIAWAETALARAPGYPPAVAFLASLGR